MSGAERTSSPDERALPADSAAPTLDAAPLADDGRDGAGSAPTAPADGALEGYVALALAQAPELLARAERVEAARSRGEQVRALPEPTLSVTEFLEELQTRTGPNERRLRLDQAFPWPGTLGARGELADAEAARLDAELVARRAEVAERVETAWLELALARERLRIAAAEVDLLRNLEPVVASRVTSGGPREDTLELEIAIARTERRREEAEALLPPLSARLASLCGLRADGPPLPASLDGVGDRDLDREALGAAATASDPRSAALVAALERAEAARRVADLADRPSLGVGVEYVQIGDALDPNTPEAGQDPIAVRLSIGLPLWRGAYRAAAREAELAERAARLDLDARALELSAELAQVRFALEEADRELVLVRDTLRPRARDVVELVQSSYTTGRADLSDLLEAERRLLELELEEAHALADRGRAEARLRALAGETLR